MGKRKSSPSMNLRAAVECLEKRDVPATWGIPWPQAQHLTLSFVPDGTSVQGQSSRLFGTLDAQLGAGNWQSAILDAFQSWAANTNVNIGLVADGGQPSGVAGAAQGDARFGDIRVSAVPLPAGVAAITSPYDPGTGTLSGDLILNSNDDFSSATGYDLYTVALHEAGHSFGFADSPDPSSFMYDVYGGPQTSLSPAAIAAVQSLYGGPRSIAAVNGGSNVVDVTSQLSTPTRQMAVYGDLGKVGDAQYFQFKAPDANSAPNGVDVQVEAAGISQLASRVTVTDSSGNVVAAATAAVQGSNVSVHLDNLASGKVYKVKVDGPSNDVYAVGSFVLSIGATASANSLAAGFAKATSLPGKVGPIPAVANTKIASTKQFDYYKFQTPTLLTSGINVQLQAYGIGLIAPQVALYTASGTLLAQAVASDPSNPSATLSVSNVSPNSTYYIRVVSGTLNASQFGTYQISATTASIAASASAPIMQGSWLGSDDAKLSAPNNTLNSAAKLVTPKGYQPGTFYAAAGGIGVGTAASQYYIATTPSGKPGFMTVSVQTIGSSGLVPVVSVMDKKGNAVSSRVLAQSDGVSVVQVPFSGSTDFVIKVSSSVMLGGGSTGNYYLSTTFGTVASSLANLAAGSLASNATGTASLTTPSSGLYQFVLAGDPSNARGDTLLRMTIKDASGNVVATQSAAAGEATSLNVLLPAGDYTIFIDAYSPSGAVVPALSYSLFGANLTDPIKVFANTAGASSSTKI